MRASLLLSLSGLILAAPLAADFDPVEWKLRRRLPVARGFSVVALNRGVYAGSRADLADLRVVRDQSEVPYVLEKLAGAVEQREHAVTIVNQAATREGVELTLTLDAREKHNRVRLETSRRNFRQAVRIETSDDGRTWALARADGWIFDFSQDDRRISSLAVDYPASTRRHVRVTVRGWSDVKAVTAAWLALHTERPASREALATLTPQVSEDSKTRTTLLVIDAGVAGLPADRLRIETTTAAFHRAAQVERSDDSKEWVRLADGVLAWQEETGQPALAIPESHARYYRVRIHNRDDQPLAIGQVVLEGLVRHVKFDSSAPGQYWLYYGRPDARQPGYDLAMLLPKREHVAAAVIAPEPEQANPMYRPSEPRRPWSERHRAILYAVLAFAVAGLGAATIRFIGKIRQT